MVDATFGRRAALAALAFTLGGVRVSSWLRRGPTRGTHVAAQVKMLAGSGSFGCGPSADQAPLAGALPAGRVVPTSSACGAFAAVARVEVTDATWVGGAGGGVGGVRQQREEQRPAPGSGAHSSPSDTDTDTDADTDTDTRAERDPYPDADHRVGGHGPELRDEGGPHGGQLDVLVGR